MVTTDREEAREALGLMGKVQGIGKSLLQGGIIVTGFALALYSMSLGAAET